MPFVPDLAWPVLYALLLWWASTAIILYLDLLPPRTFPWSMLGASILAAACLYDLVVTRQDVSVAGAYRGFTAGLLLWGWQIIAFYMGYVTGPRWDACPDTCRGWQRFIHGVQVCLYHELAAAAGAAVVVWLSWGAPNQVGAWTYLVLWGMHESAKLNVFFGVPNLNAHFLPAHMDVLKSLMRVRPMNLFFPVSVTLPLIGAVLLIVHAVDAQSGAVAAVGYSFVVTMLALAILEHWFLVLPIPAADLWAWSLKARRVVSLPRRTTAAIQAPAIQTPAGRQ